MSSDTSQGIRELTVLVIASGAPNGGTRKTSVITTLIESPVQLLGIVEDETLTVSENVQT